ncbi:MAG: cytidine deaminase [Rhodoferax sp.]
MQTPSPIPLPQNATLPNVLIDAARAAQQRAYAPYSGFAVGAAVLDAQGRIHAGCNVENAAYPEGLCAEAAALSAMVLAGAQYALALVLVADTPPGAPWISPCGGCRQKLAELGGPELIVQSARPDALGPRWTLAQLLPEHFALSAPPPVSPAPTPGD